MQIGKVAARTELSLRTIRHYEGTVARLASCGENLGPDELALALTPALALALALAHQGEPDRKLPREASTGWPRAILAHAGAIERWLEMREAAIR